MVYVDHLSKLLLISIHMNGLRRPPQSDLNIHFPVKKRNGLRRPPKFQRNLSFSTIIQNFKKVYVDHLRYFSCFLQETDMNSCTKMVKWSTQTSQIHFSVSMWSTQTTSNIIFSGRTRGLRRPLSLLTDNFYGLRRPLTINEVDVDLL